MILLTLMKGDKGIEVSKERSNCILLNLFCRDWYNETRKIATADALPRTACKAGVYLIKIWL